MRHGLQRPVERDGELHYRTLRPELQYGLFELRQRLEQRL